VLIDQGSIRCPDPRLEHSVYLRVLGKPFPQLWRAWID
jgi:hypothetical protein